VSYPKTCSSERFTANGTRLSRMPRLGLRDAGAGPYRRNGNFVLDVQFVPAFVAGAQAPYGESRFEPVQVTPSRGTAARADREKSIYAIGGVLRRLIRSVRALQ
jgi:hypothetical protein